MIKSIKSIFGSFVRTFENVFTKTGTVTNTYCIPCTWTIQGKVYIEAQSADLAKTYVRTHEITPDMEECYCLNINPDTEHPILCKCGSCGNEYVVSRFHIHPKCPYCENEL